MLDGGSISPGYALAMATSISSAFFSTYICQPTLQDRGSKIAVALIHAPSFGPSLVAAPFAHARAGEEVAKKSVADRVAKLAMEMVAEAEADGRSVALEAVLAQAFETVEKELAAEVAQAQADLESDTQFTAPLGAMRIARANALKTT